MSALRFTDAARRMGRLRRTTLHGETWGHLLHSIRTGDNAFIDLHGKSVWQFREEHPEENEVFNRAMSALSRGNVEAIVKAYDFSKFRHIVDVGGGQGQLIIGVLNAHHEIRGILFDQRHVVTKTEAIIAAANLKSRCQIVAGNFFESVPAGADAYLMRIVLHDWEDHEALSILKVCREAVKPNSKLLIIERVIAPPNDGLASKLSDLNMLVSPGGCERTREEFADLCKAADFELTNVVPEGPALSVIEATPP